MHSVDSGPSALVSVAIHIPIQLILPFTAIHLRKLMRGIKTIDDQRCYISFESTLTVLTN